MQFEMYCPVCRTAHYINVGNNDPKLNMTGYHGCPRRPTIAIKHRDPNECILNLANAVRDLQAVMGRAIESLNAVTAFCRIAEEHVKTGDLIELTTKLREHVNYHSLTGYGVCGVNSANNYEPPNVELERAP